MEPVELERRKDREKKLLLDEISVLEDRKDNIDKEIQDKKRAYKDLCFAPKTYFELIEQ